MGRSGGRTKVKGTFGRQHLIKPGVIDKGAKDLFSSGHCHSLALAINESSGFEIAGLVDREFDVFHLFNISPSGQAIDIEGAMSLDDYREEAFKKEPDFIGLSRRIKPETVKKLGPGSDWLEIDIGLGRMFAGPVLKSAGF